MKSETKKVLIGGTAMGIALCIASNLQQFAFSYPDHSPGKIAFITAFYMFFVPLIGLFLKNSEPQLPADTDFVKIIDGGRYALKED